MPLERRVPGELRGAGGRGASQRLSRWLRRCGRLLAQATARVLTERGVRSLPQALLEGRPLAPGAPDLRRLVERSRMPLSRLPEGGLVHRSGERVLIGPHWSKHRVRRYRVG